MLPSGSTQPVPRSVPSVWAKKPRESSAPVVGVEHRAALAHRGAQALAEAGELGELRFVVQRAVFAHALRLRRLAADDAAPDDHVREAEADGVEALQAPAQQRLHALAGIAHLRVARLFVKGGLERGGDAPQGAVAAGPVAHQPREQQHRLDQRLGAVKTGGEPVVFLKHAQLSIHAGGELHVRAAHVHAHQYPSGGAGGQFVKHQRACERGGRFFPRGRQRGDVARGDAKSRALTAQRRQRALVDVQAFAIT